MLASRLVSERRELTAICVAGLAIVGLALAVPAKFGRFATLGVSVSWLMLLVYVVRPRACNRSARALGGTAE